MKKWFRRIIIYNNIKISMFIFIYEVLKWFVVSVCNGINLINKLTNHTNKENMIHHKCPFFTSLFIAHILFQYLFFPINKLTIENNWVIDNCF